jgi:hypothetical protein
MVPLALTGQGHHSEFAVDEAFKPLPVQMVFDTLTKKPHPLTMKFEAMKGGKLHQRSHLYFLRGW